MTKEELEQRDAKRLRYLNAVFEASEGEEGGFVPDELAEERAAITADEGRAIRKYLEGEGLLRVRGIGTSGMTHAGIVEMEAAIREPAKRTEHFSERVLNIAFHIDSITGSNVQVGSHHSTQTLQAPALDPNQLLALRNTLDGIAMRIQELGLSPDQRKEVEDLIASARPLLGTQKHHGVVREAVKSLRNVLEGIVANAIAAGFFAELAALPF